MSDTRADQKPTRRELIAATLAVGTYAAPAILSASVPATTSFVSPLPLPTVLLTSSPLSITLNSTTSQSAVVSFVVTIGNPGGGILDGTIDYGDGIRETFSTTTTVTKGHVYTNAAIGTASIVTAIVTIVDRTGGSTTSATTTVVILH